VVILQQKFEMHIRISQIEKMMGKAKERLCSRQWGKMWGIWGRLHVVCKAELHSKNGGGEYWIPSSYQLP
jgi:hypothetical protein